MTFPLVKKLKDPIQQKVLVGVALLLLVIGGDFRGPDDQSAVIMGCSGSCSKCRASST